MAAGMKLGSASADDESRSIIFEGANVTQLVYLFKMDIRTIKSKIYKANVKPVKRVKSPTGQPVDLYAVHEVAPHLVKPVVDVEAYIRSMNHADLPKHLTKEFWAGQRSRQDYEEKAGRLWPTEKVVEEVGDLAKLVKMSVLLMNDAVERNTELSNRQKDIIKSLSHGMLKDLMLRIEEKFKVEPSDSYVQHPQEDEDEEL